MCVSQTTVQLDAPVFVTWYQCLVTVALCMLLSQLAARYPNYVTFPEFNIDKKLSREVRLNVREP